MTKTNFEKVNKAASEFLDNGGVTILTRMSEPDFNRLLDSVMRFVREGAGTHDIECTLCNAIEEAYKLGFEDGKEFQKNDSESNER